MIGFGVFLIVAGLSGFLSNPAAAKTALISGGLFGTFSILLGLGMRKAQGFLRWISLIVVGMLSGVFTWRSSVTWLAHQEGEPKLFAAILITGMLIAAIATIIRLLRG